jgi:SpoVK/Ycf46/Vps4 family AAA+-type ATPase
MQTQNESEFVKHKFRDLKVYCSTEWLADNKKKYRQVFDRYETNYLYAELSFFNKYFDVDDWDVRIVLKCFSLKKGRKELCELHFERKVSKYDHVVYIREGWGNKKTGAFWKRGTYFWEAYVDGTKVATKYFYVEDTGRTQPETEAYVNLRAIRLYEAPYDDVAREERRYLRTFARDETRYIFAEIVLDNLLVNRSWYSELIVKFYNGARELKGQTVRLHRVEKDDELIEVTASWGSNAKGSWREDRYTVEVVFMDRLLAVVPFEVRETAEEGYAPLISPFQSAALAQPAAGYPDHERFEDVMTDLDALIGLHDIKRKVREHAQYLKFLQLRRSKGFDESEALNIHSVFIGNPGTGKTTVAKMMGRLYRHMGLLSKGHVHEVDRVDLVGEYIGQTAPKVKEAIDKARGGVLFIDEAYSLARANDDTKDFGREAVEILVKEMSEGSRDLAIIVAGYPKEMKHFLESNPGLKSRFKLFFEFTDYLPDELFHIADFTCERKKVHFSPAARLLAEEMIVAAYRKRDRSFGNARFVKDLVEQAKIQMGLRLMEDPQPHLLSTEALSLVEPTDMERIELGRARRKLNLPIDQKLLDEALLELDRMIGIGGIKEEIRQMVRLVRFYRETQRDVLNKFFLHTVLVGNPGTGKTTVARILTKIYKALGILERGHIVETDRQGLVAGFVGQTAIKTAEKIEEAIGGVLFIDEAYSLSEAAPRAGGDFGSEAIQTLLKRMEDRRGEFFLFVAGYPENMEAFLKANPGLRSRFDKTFKFEDYSPEELFEIAAQMLLEEGLSPTPEAEEHLRRYLRFLHEYRDKYFGNARTVRGVITEAVKCQSLRLAALPTEERTSEATSTLTLEDLESFKLDKSAFGFSRATIGFHKK